MSDQLWSWILSIVGLTGLFLAGKKIWWAWYLNIAGQALWFAYAIATEQYGFFIAAFGYTFVFTKNAISWTRDHRERKMLDSLSEKIRNGIMTANEARALRGYYDE